MEDSYVKISTKFTEWDWYRDSNTKVLFLHFLLKANTKDVCHKGIEIPRGSLVTSYQILSNETGLSVKNIRTALSHLKMAGEVAISKYPKNTVITVKNWDAYYLDGKVNGTEVAGIERKERKEAKERLHYEILRKFEGSAQEQRNDAKRTFAGARRCAQHGCDVGNGQQKA